MKYGRDSVTSLELVLFIQLGKDVLDQGVTLEHKESCRGMQTPEKMN